jgi:hypothetical protein
MFNQQHGSYFNPTGDDTEPHQEKFTFNPVEALQGDFMGEPAWVWWAFIASTLLFLKAWGNVLAHLDI